MLCRQRGQHHFAATAAATQLGNTQRERERGQQKLCVCLLHKESCRRSSRSDGQSFLTNTMHAMRAKRQPPSLLLSGAALLTLLHWLACHIICRLYFAGQSLGDSSIRSLQWGTRSAAGCCCGCCCWPCSPLVAMRQTHSRGGRSSKEATARGAGRKRQEQKIRSLARSLSVSH